MIKNTKQATEPAKQDFLKTIENRKILRENERQGTSINVYTSDFGRGGVRVHIREFYTDPKTEEVLPTKKGLSLSIDNDCQEVKELVKLLMEVTEMSVIELLSGLEGVNAPVVEAEDSEDSEESEEEALTL